MKETNHGKSLNSESSNWNTIVATPHILTELDISQDWEELNWQIHEMKEIMEAISGSGNRITTMYGQVLQITFRLDSPSENIQKLQYNNIQGDGNRIDKNWLQSVLSLVHFPTTTYI